MTDETHRELTLINATLLGYVAVLMATDMAPGEEREDMLAVIRDQQQLLRRARHEIERPEDRG